MVGSKSAMHSRFQGIAGIVEERDSITELNPSLTYSQFMEQQSKGHPGGV